MTAPRLVDVTLVMAWSPRSAVPGGQPESDAPRIVFAIALDAQGQPDADAWQADPSPWPARLERAGAAPVQGDVAHDEGGWSLRFFASDAAAAEAPLHRLLNIAPLRPGEVLTLRAPNGGEEAWRVVGVG